MCFLAKKEIPMALPPSADNKVETDKAILALKAYVFIIQQEGQDSFDMYKLVRLVIQNWLAQEGQRKACVTDVIHQFAEVYPLLEHKNRHV
jgi:hypothetical protein